MPLETSAIVKHTPGPWARVPDERFRHDNSAGVRDATGSYVAAALDFNRSDRDAEVEANARLIAAAPELLATLKDVIAHLRSITLDPGDDEDDAPALVAAETLVAKAEGRA